MAGISPFAIATISSPREERSMGGRTAMEGILQNLAVIK